MAVRSSFFNSVNGDRRYKSNHFAEYFASFIANGIFPNPSNTLQVYEKTNMTVTVKPGKGWINGYFAVNEYDYDLTLDNADGILNRIDRIVLRLDFNARSIDLAVKKGAFASAPVAPILQRDADAHELALADIYVTKGTTFIRQSNIADQRLDKALCGVVHGTVSQVDTTTIFNQYSVWFAETTGKTESEINQWQLTAKAEFDQWFASIQNILDGDVAANLAARITTLEQNLATHQAEYARHETDGSAHGIGDKSILKTSAKDTIVNAVNELFTGVSDGKNNIGTAITDVDTNLTVPTNPTFLELATLIRNISTGVPTKTLWNSGVSNGRKYYQINKDAIYYNDNGINYAKKLNGEVITIVTNGAVGDVIGLYEDYYVTIKNSSNVSTGATLRFYSITGTLLFSFTVPYQSTSPYIVSCACCKIGDRVLYADLSTDSSRGYTLYVYSLTGTLISTLKDINIFQYGNVRGFLVSNKKNKAILYMLNASYTTCSLREASVNANGDFVETYSITENTDIISAVMRLFYYYYN